MPTATNHDAPIQLRGNIVDLEKRFIAAGIIRIHDHKIAAIEIIGPEDKSLTYFLPGFIDAHIHIESSMLVPTEFARLATPHGTVATVSDPHEIANILGIPGIHFMLENAAQTPLKIMFGAPPCVPATHFETSGSTLTPDHIAELLQNPRIGYLAEVMNYPGVINNDPDLLAKIQHARAAKKPIDGHAPGLRGAGIAKYFGHYITTDHECYTLEEALEKLEAAPNLHILIREGSAAKNFDALHPLLRSHPARVMFCSDDKHPNDLEVSHINALVTRSLALGYDLFDILRAASVNPVRHYQLPVGLLRINDPADFIEIKNLHSFQILRTFIDGQLVAENGQSLLPSHPTNSPNIFHTHPKSPADFAVPTTSAQSHILANVIQTFDGQLVTARLQAKLPVADAQVHPDLAQDILKFTVVNRYANTPPAVAFLQGFGMKHGAIASCVAHDSHNIVAVGVSDHDLARAVNLVIAQKGGLSAVNAEHEKNLPLPVGGIMTQSDGRTVAAAYNRIDKLARSLCTGPQKPLTAPFMTLSFMALLVIPSLKLSDQGLFDADQFKFIPLCPI